MGHTPGDPESVSLNASYHTEQQYMFDICVTNMFLNGLCDIKSYMEEVCLFVLVLRPSQPNGVMSSAVSLPNHTFTGQAQSSKQLTSIVHILSPETDNCPS